MNIFRLKAGRKPLSALLSFSVTVSMLLTLLFPGRVFAAPAWPSDILVQAEGAILMDADSGCVIYGQNIHQQFFPASITKILTALIVLERCDPEEVVTFSHNAVYNVERGSTSAGYDTGDQITVREALYAMLLKSANEVANALAEHCAGSIEAFADLMNEKAAALGCTDSHFANPSGLNDPNHYTTAYDYALIAKAAFENQTFVEYDSTTYHELEPNATNSVPFTVYCGHKMMKKNSGMYYPGIIGGKTGYTTLAGNTLVTCAEREGLKLITVILNGHQTHYTDTQALLDFGFANFQNLTISDHETVFSNLDSDINLAGTRPALLQVAEGRSVTLPKGAVLSDADWELSYELTEKDPPNAVASLTYRYQDRVIGSTWLLSADNVSIAAEFPEAPPVETGRSLPDRLSEQLSDLSENGPLLAVLLVLLAAVAVCLVLLLRRTFSRQAADEIRISQAMRRIQEQDSNTIQENIYHDSASSVDRYLPDSRLNRSGPGRWFRRKG